MQQSNLHLTYEEIFSIEELERQLNRRSGNLLRVVVEEIPNSASQKDNEWKKQNQPLTMPLCFNSAIV